MLGFLIGVGSILYSCFFTSKLFGCLFVLVFEVSNSFFGFIDFCRDTFVYDVSHERCANAFFFFNNFLNIVAKF